MAAPPFRSAGDRAFAEAFLASRPAARSTFDALAAAVARQAVHLGGTVAVPHMDVGGMGELVYLKDPDGNIFGYTGPPAKGA